jgi:hypothetical protein
VNQQRENLGIEGLLDSGVIPLVKKLIRNGDGLGIRRTIIYIDFLKRGRSDSINDAFKLL